jgi:multiple sugar transport system permease protein
MPLVRPALATLTILTFQSAWNSTEASSLFINSESIKNFAFYMSNLSSAAGNGVAGQGVGAAAALLMFLPNLVLFIILQSKVMSTMAHSGIK